jgi:hypothetical protein
MTSKTRLRDGWVLAIALLLAPAAYAQRVDQRDQETQTPPEEREQDEPVFRLNISPVLLDQGIDLLVEKRLTRDFGLDEFQAEEMRLLLHERLPKFLAEYQGELEALVSEWLEAASAAEPPTAEFAADWAARLRPIVEETEVMVDGLAEDMREFLNDDQRVLLDGFQAGIQVATRNVKGRLYEFEQGHFDPEIHWVRNREARRRGPKEIKALARQMDVARREAMEGNVEPVERPVKPAQIAEKPGSAAGEHELAEPASPAEAQAGSESVTKGKTGEKKDEWTLYVEAFIRRYKLDDEQQQKAQHFLERAQASRDRYLARKGVEMERITKMFQEAKNEQQRATVEKAHARFQQPLDGMFDRLKRDLETLPTRAQRRTAAQSDAGRPEADAGAEKAAGDKLRPQ